MRGRRHIYGIESRSCLMPDTIVVIDFFLRSTVVGRKVIDKTRIHYNIGIHYHINVHLDIAVWRRPGCRRPGVASLPPTTAWIDEFSVERYRPMLLLLSVTDRSVTPKLVAHFRRARYRIFRGYLRLLATDFTRVVAALKLVMTQASSDRPDLAALLIRSQATFAACMVLAHVQLLLYRFGIGTVSIDAPLKLFEGMRLELRTLVPRTVGAAS